MPCGMLVGLASSLVEHMTAASMWGAHTQVQADPGSRQASIQRQSTFFGERPNSREGFLGRVSC
jgi:hypothetical protein